jgi:hypothetical protein
MPETAAGFRDYCVCKQALKKGDEEADFGWFKGPFGRCQQYLSFIRRE